MRIELPRQRLLNALQTVAAAVPSKTPKDIVKLVLLTTGERVTLLATDTESTIRATLPETSAEESLRVLLPPAKLLAILRESDAEVVTLDVSADKIVVRTGRSKFELQATDPAWFPEFPSLDGLEFTVHADSLTQAIERTAFATDPTSTRYGLGGVCFERGFAVATDTRRLAVASVPIDIDRECIVPVKALNLFKGLAGDVLMTFGANAMTAEAGGTLIHTRLVEGRFPRWRDILPTDYRIGIELVAGPFLSAVRQSMIVTNEESRGVDFTFADGNLTLNSVGADVGTSEVVLPISHDGEEISVALDPRFVVDFLKALESTDSIGIRIIDGQSIVVFTIGDAYRYGLMPIRVQE